MKDKQIHFMDRTSLYDCLPEEMLAGFYYQLQRNIEKGILSKTMYQELRLIENSARRRGMSIECLNKQGRMVIAKELSRIIG